MTLQTSFAGFRRTALNRFIRFGAAGEATSCSHPRASFGSFTFGLKAVKLRAFVVCRFIFALSLGIALLIRVLAFSVRVGRAARPCGLFARTIHARQVIATRLGRTALRLRFIFALSLSTAYFAAIALSLGGAQHSTQMDN